MRFIGKSFKNIKIWNRKIINYTEVREIITAHNQ
jgi:hypothetical protein